MHLAHVRHQLPSKQELHSAPLGALENGQVRVVGAKVQKQCPLAAILPWADWALLLQFIHMVGRDKVAADTSGAAESLAACRAVVLLGGRVELRLPLKW